MSLTDEEVIVAFVYFAVGYIAQGEPAVVKTEVPPTVIEAVEERVSHMTPHDIATLQTIAAERITLRTGEEIRANFLEYFAPRVLH